METVLKFVHLPVDSHKTRMPVYALHLEDQYMPVLTQEREGIESPDCHWFNLQKSSLENNER